MMRCNQVMNGRLTVEVWGGPVGGDEGVLNRIGRLLAVP